MASVYPLLVAQYGECLRLIEECTQEATKLVGKEVERPVRTLKKRHTAVKSGAAVPQVLPLSSAGADIVPSGQSKAALLSVPPQAARPTATKSSQLRPSQQLQPPPKKAKAASQPEGLMQAPLAKMPLAKSLPAVANLPPPGAAGSATSAGPGAKPKAEELRARLLALKEKAAQLEALSKQRESSVGDGVPEVSPAPDASEEHAVASAPAAPVAAVRAVSGQPAAKAAVASNAAATSRPAAAVAVAPPVAEEEADDEDMDDADLMASLQGALGGGPAVAEPAPDEDAAAAAVEASDTGQQEEEVVEEEFIEEEEGEEEEEEYDPFSTTPNAPA